MDNYFSLLLCESVLNWNQMSLLHVNIEHYVLDTNGEKQLS